MPTLTQTKNPQVQTDDRISVHVTVEPFPGCEVGAFTQEHLFLVANTGQPYTPRVKLWLNQQYPHGYRILDLWVPEPISEILENFSEF